jgi:ERCC4-related helicase
VKIDLADMDHVSWRKELAATKKTWRCFVNDLRHYAEHDTKLQTLFELLRAKQQHPINDGNRKILIFTAFSDTANYLYANVSKFIKTNFGLNTAMIPGRLMGKPPYPSSELT